MKRMVLKDYAIHLDPVLAHIRGICHQSQKTANVQRCLPMIDHGAGLREEEHCCRNDGNGDDPKRDGNAIVQLEKNINCNLADIHLKNNGAETIAVPIHDGLASLTAPPASPPKVSNKRKNHAAMPT